MQQKMVRGGRREQLTALNHLLWCMLPAFHLLLSSPESCSSKRSNNCPMVSQTGVAEEFSNPGPPNPKATFLPFTPPLSAQGQWVPKLQDHLGSLAYFFTSTGFSQPFPVAPPLSSTLLLMNSTCSWFPKQSWPWGQASCFSQSPPKDVCPAFLSPSFTPRSCLGQGLG